MLGEIVKMISSASGLDTDEIKKRIEEKQIELSNLVSEEGAAYIIAKEMGINLLRQAERLNIENIIPGMQNVDIISKVTRISKRDFDTEKAKGRVASIFLSDNTGSIRLVLWNDEIDKIGDIAEGDAVHVKGFARDGMFGPELRLGRHGLIQKSSEKIMIDVPAQRRYERCKISDLRDGYYKEIRAALVQVFESNPFYEVCPICGARVREENNYTCEEHGRVEPSYGLVVSGIIDDGTENIRVVLFREHAEKILGMSLGKAREVFMRKMDKSAIYENVELGKEYLFEGAIRRNKLFDRLEFVATNVVDVDVVKEIEMMLDSRDV